MGAGDDDRGKGLDSSDGEDESSSRGVLRLIGGGGGGKAAFEDGDKDKQPPEKDGDGAGGAMGTSDDEVRRTRALRRYVCHVLGVDVRTEGEALVPSSGIEGSSVSRIDWARVGVITEDLARKVAGGVVGNVGGGGGEGRLSGVTTDGGVGGTNSDPAAVGATTTTTAFDSTSGSPPTATVAAGATGEPNAAVAAGAQKPSTTTANKNTTNDPASADHAASSPLLAPGSTAAGRVGPPRVEVDRAHMAGDVRLDEAGTAVTSHSNFSSVRANACVFAGKWVYEATLGSSGIMQLGQGWHLSLTLCCSRYN